MLQAIQMSGHVGDDGILRLEIPVEMVDQDVEATIVVHMVVRSDLQMDKNGYPIGFFQAIDQIVADDIIERPDQGVSETRQNLE